MLGDFPGDAARLTHALTPDGWEVVSATATEGTISHVTEPRPFEGGSLAEIREKVPDGWVLLYVR